MFRDSSQPAEHPPAFGWEALTAEFYAWEQRGRGWQLWDYPVALEPPFAPFLYHGGSAFQATDEDDGRRPSFFHRLLLELRDALRRRGTDSVEQDLPSESEPDPFLDESALVEIRAVVSRDFRLTPAAAEQFLLSLTSAKLPLCFEVIARSETIATQWVCRKPDRSLLGEALRAHFPAAVLSEEVGFLAQCMNDTASHELAIVEYGLSNEFMRPLRTFRSFELDPLTSLIGAAMDLDADEAAAVQLLWQPVRKPWAESMVRAVSDHRGGCFFVDAPEMLALARGKGSRPLFAVVVRMAAASPSAARAEELVIRLDGALRQFAEPLSNELIPLEAGEDDAERVRGDLLLRQSHRSGMLLNSEELVGFVHLPSASVHSEKLIRQARKTKAAPPVVLGHDLALGTNTHAGKSTVVSLSATQRIRHTHVIGASGTGKSTFLLNLILQDMESGQGFGVLDPHGDLIDQIITRVPEHRIEDVVLFDSSDEEYAVGLNLLSAHSTVEKNLLASDLVAVFQRLSTSWGDQMTSVLGNAIQAFLESSVGGTLADLRRFLVEPEFRRQFLQTVQDEEVVYYWLREFPLLAGRPQAPLLTRLDTFLRPRLIRRMVCQKEKSLDFGRIMSEGRIFLAKLAQGAIGEENSYLLGSFLVTKFHQMAIGRQELAETQRRPFMLYLDEFHNFLTPSMNALLSGARKYRLGLILAHQELRQLGTRDGEILQAVLTNPATRVCFRVGDDDAKRLADGFASFDAADLLNLGTGEALCRVEQAQYDFNLKSAPLPPVAETVAEERRNRIVALSRERYALRQAPALEPVQPAVPIVSPALPPVTPSTPRPEPQPTPAPKVKPDRRALAAASARPGRGGETHKYLQSLIQNTAHAQGYRVVIEKPILAGQGCVDVALERKDRSIACEISVSSTPEQELGNVQKCLAAGFTHVVVISRKPQALGRTRKFIQERLDEDSSRQVQFLSPEEFLAWLPLLSVAPPPEPAAKTTRGYRVNLAYDSVDPAEVEARRRQISSILGRRIKRNQAKDHDPDNEGNLRRGAGEG